MERSWPAPLEHYREMAFEGPEAPIPVPTLYLIGDADGCVEPGAAKGQAKYFSGEFEERVLPGVGHFLHLESPALVEPLAVDWLTRR